VRRPVAIWLILVWYLYKAAGYAIGLSYLKASRQALPGVEMVHGMTSSPSLNYALGLIAPLLFLAGAVALLFLRRAAAWLFFVALVVSVALSSVTLGRWLHMGVQGVLLTLNAALNLAIGAGVSWYSWHLRRAGRLS
jgi:hypothetical protein